MATQPLDEISLGDPDLFVDGAPHELLTELRATTPVRWQEMDGEPGFWAVLTPRRRRARRSPAEPVLRERGRRRARGPRRRSSSR